MFPGRLMPNRSRQELLDLCVFLFPRKGNKKKNLPHVRFGRCSPQPVNTWMLVSSSFQRAWNWVIWLFAGFGKTLPALLHHLPTRTSSRPAAGATWHNRPPKKLRFYIRPPGDSCYSPPPGSHRRTLCWLLASRLCFPLQTQAPLTAAIRQLPQ